jgi:hypothetical protein
MKFSTPLNAALFVLMGISAIGLIAPQAYPRAQRDHPRGGDALISNGNIFLTSPCKDVNACSKDK